MGSSSLEARRGQPSQTEHRSGAPGCCHSDMHRVTRGSQSHQALVSSASCRCLAGVQATRLVWVCLAWRVPQPAPLVKTRTRQAAHSPISIRPQGLAVVGQ